MPRITLIFAVAAIATLSPTPSYSQLDWIIGKHPHSVAIDISLEGDWNIATRTVTPGYLSVFEILRLQDIAFPPSPVAFHVDHRGHGWELERLETAGELACVELRYDVGYASSREILWRAKGRKLKSRLISTNVGLWTTTPDNRLLRLELPRPSEAGMRFELLEFDQRGRIRKSHIPYQADPHLPRGLGRKPLPGAFADLPRNRLLFLERIPEPFVDSFPCYQPRDHVVWWVVSKKTGENFGRGVAAIEDCAFGSIPGHLTDDFGVVGMDSSNLAVLVEKDLMWMDGNSRRDCDTTQSVIVLLRFNLDGDIIRPQESALPRLVRREFISSPSSIFFLPCTAPQHGIIGGRVYSVGVNGEFSTFEF